MRDHLEKITMDNNMQIIYCVMSTINCIQRSDTYGRIYTFLSYYCVHFICLVKNNHNMINKWPDIFCYRDVTMAKNFYRRLIIFCCGAGVIFKYMFTALDFRRIFLLIFLKTKHTHLIAQSNRHKSCMHSFF